MTYLQALLDSDKNELVNDIYNRRVEALSDYEEGERDPHGYGKRIPYIGWFWRHTDFVGKSVAIGHASYVGVMENNKWDYPERMMTEQEVDTFVGFLERAFTEEDKRGTVSEMKARRDRVFEEMWDWFQTLHIEEASDGAS